MKLKIKVREITKGCMPKLIEKGDWIDLYSAQNVNIKGPSLDANGNFKINWTKIGLGIAVEMPEGFEAVVAPRSSTFKAFGMILSNSIGVIDYIYKGNDDEWSFAGIALKNGSVKQGERVCQFRIQPSQKATMLQKLKWLFSNGVEIVRVNELNNPNRGGYGTTGR